jgi:hypothetical protein
LIGWITVIFIGTFIQNWKNVRLGSGIHCPMGGLESQISAGESNISSILAAFWEEKDSPDTHRNKLGHSQGVLLAS